MTFGEFKKAYESFYIERFIYSSAELEDISDLEKRKKIMTNLLGAYHHLIEQTDKLTLGDILVSGDLVNEGYNVPKGFRKIGVMAGDKANFEPLEPSRIIPSLYELLYSYYNIWDELDVFLKEAMFHIRYMHIHPFEDGNKRSGKIILATNLCKQGYPPIIITKEDTEEYYNYVNNYDYEGFADFLRQRSKVEDNTMCGFYKSLYGIPVYEEIEPKKLQLLLKPRKTI